MSGQDDFQLNNLYRSDSSAYDRILKQLRKGESRNKPKVQGYFAQFIF
jgi:hypothetical protein